MPINLSIKDAYKADLIAFYSSKRKQLQDELISVEEVLGQLGGKKESNTNSSESVASITLSSGDSSGYNPNWNWWKKIRHVLLDVKGGLTTKDIVSKVLDYEPGLHDDRTKVVRSISSVLSTTARAENSPLLREINERGDFLYGLKKK